MAMVPVEMENWKEVFSGVGGGRGSNGVGGWWRF